MNTQPAVKNTNSNNDDNTVTYEISSWMVEQCFTSPPTQYRSYGSEAKYKVSESISKELT